MLVSKEIMNSIEYMDLIHKYRIAVHFNSLVFLLYLMSNTPKENMILNFSNILLMNLYSLSIISCYTCPNYYTYHD